jgi:signal transduction histidine kinase
VYSLVVEVKDITEKKRMEENLRQYSLHLEKLVEERTRMLHDAERMAAIGELAAMVGHDLRNPLMGIAGAAYYLKSKIGSKLDEKTLEMFNHIERGIEYSDKIINDLLDYSKNIQLNFLEITPREMILESLQLIKVPNNVEIINETQIKPRIKVDVEKMKRVFINIINNSFDAMPNGGKLTIRGRKNKDCFEFHLSDTGMGVPRKIKQKLWNPLITSKAKGMGLGLAICKRMIDAHNGSITLKSTVGKGTTLIVKVPIEPKL